MMNNNDEFGSLRNIKRAEPNPYLFTRIQARLDAERGSTRLSPAGLRIAFALSVVVVTINVAAVVTHARRASTGLQAQSSSYDLSGDRYNLYDI